MDSPVNRAVRVLILSRGGPLDGAQRQLFYLMQGLDRTRYEPVAMLDGGGALAEGLRGLGLQVVETPMRDWRRFPEALWRYTDARRMLETARGLGVGLVHASDLWKSGYAHFVSRRMGVPGVLHVRGPVTAHDIRKHRVHDAARVIAIAGRYGEDLVRAGVAAGRVADVSDAVDLAYFRRNETGAAALRREWGVREGEIVVGMIGRVEAFKRVTEFLEAAGRLPAAVAQRTRFILVGEEGPADYMRQVREIIGRLSLEQRVVMPGRRQDMPAVLSGLDLLVTMSGGSVMFEAMACAVPVMSVRGDGRHSAHTRHGETAWCVTTNDAGMVAAELERVLMDGGLRRRLGETGCAWAAERLPVERMVRETEAVYRAALEGR